ncbi:hypothetical protein CPB83DRAFT_805557 [Crepidotus variabilis]|uniref:Uncharacterized protein n=1 Tax=Crepidotus variabilis TaxID=179855 RepID=A0A9P6EPG0_9AGAR|nr:hypothetical protein CPB83DRAFT_805557 [Crepidotus variabilis]
MTFLLLFISLIAPYITHANAHGLAPRDEPTPTDSNPPDPRTVYSIAYSCLATIFLCTWVSVHPNIPASGESSFRITLKRVKNMLYGLVFPEAMLCWAMNQWFGARRMTQEFKAQGWTNTHGFFLQMGGLHYCEGEGDTEIFDYYDGLQEFFEPEIKKMVELVSAQEIQDKSKSDFLSKALAVIQTTWFIAQCIARGIQGLAVTELELLTVALAALNGLMYFFWWSKPFDVRSPILVHCEPCRSHALREVESEFQKLTSGLKTSEQEKGTSAPPIESPQKAKLQKHSTKDTTITLNPFKLVWFTIRAFISDLGHLFSPDGDVQRSANAVPEYYAVQSKISEIYRLIFIGVIGSAFGGLHLIAWNFAFPGFHTWLLWQSAAIVMTATPVLYGICGLMVSTPQDSSYSFLILLSIILFPIITCAYIAARISLVVEAFLLLKHLPDSAYIDVEWTRFVPHIW